ncbi:LCCL domain-containing protein [Phlyctema vagabunda]|uniref:LCCL domain-containing protein n=1 Tax=Phlyctema vagabunda TaxID=108571 RepID=A0ABR4PQM2_9HELO
MSTLLHGPGSESYGRPEDDGESEFDEEEGLGLVSEMEELELDNDDDNDGSGDDNDEPATPTTRRRYRHRHRHHHRHGSSWFRRCTQQMADWSAGPVPAQVQKIQPWFASLQEAPLRLLDQYVSEGRTKKEKKRYQMLLLCFVYTSWILIFGTLVVLAHTAPDVVSPFSGPTRTLGCTDTLWQPQNTCGLNGLDCRPFDNATFAFRCPADCASTKVWNPRTVGAQDLIYRPFVIGSGVYRGDSFLCSSAIHGGLVTDEAGGCGIVARMGEYSNFTAVQRNGIESAAFDSYFPLTFTFLDVSCKTSDGRWALLLVSFAFTTLLSLFTTSPAVLFFSTFTGVFAHVGLVSDPPEIMDLAELISNLVGKFLPAAFCVFVVYLYCVRLEGLRAQVEKTVLWLGGCWFGALSNYTLDWIPISRLTAHDIRTQPGAKVALAIIVLLLVCILFQQIYYFRREGRLRRYLSFYAFLVTVIALLVTFSSLKLRLHHYFFSLLLLPGTSLQTRPSLLYQGLLVGLFINGIARWGFDPVLQSDSVLRGDGRYGSLLPAVPTPSISPPTNITFDFRFPTPMPDFMGEQFNGVSVLVNDVERFRAYVDDIPDHRVFAWHRNSTAKEYFRFAYLQGEQAFDYTHASIWLGNGTWLAGKSGED